MNSYQPSPDESPSRKASRLGAGLCGLILALSVGLFAGGLTGGLFLMYEPDPSTSLALFCANMTSHRLHQAYGQFTDYAQSQYSEKAFTQFFTRNPVTACRYTDYALHDSGFGGATLSLTAFPIGKLTFLLELRTGGIGSFQDGFKDRWKIHSMCTAPPRREVICIQE